MNGDIGRLPWLVGREAFRRRAACLCATCTIAVAMALLSPLAHAATPEHWMATNTFTYDVITIGWHGVENDSKGDCDDEQ